MKSWLFPSSKDPEEKYEVTFDNDPMIAGPITPGMLLRWTCECKGWHYSQIRDGIGSCYHIYHLIDFLEKGIEYLGEAEGGAQRRLVESAGVDKGGNGDE